MSLRTWNTYREDYCIICMQAVWEAWVDDAKLTLVDRETGVAPWQRAREGKLHHVLNEGISEVELDAGW